MYIAKHRKDRLINDGMYIIASIRNQPIVLVQVKHQEKEVDAVKRAKELYYNKSIAFKNLFDDYFLTQTLASYRHMMQPQS